MKFLTLTTSIFLAAALAGCSNTTNTKNSNPQPKATPTIVILGSSTAAGEGANPIDSSWANRLESTNKTEVKAKYINLAVPGYSVYQAMPTGFSVSGKPSPDTARNVTKALSYKPSLIMFCFPTNEIADNYSNAEIVSAYQLLAHMMDSARVQYIISGTQPRDFASDAERMRLKTLNDTLKTVFGFHVNDILDQLSNPDYSIKAIYSAGDGIHLNNAGHAVIFQTTLRQPVLVEVVH